MTKGIDQKIVELAVPHHGALNAAMLADAGISRSSVHPRVRSGLLRSVAKGVYIVVPMQQKWSELDAALLAVPGSAASHRTAARLHDMPVYANRLEVLAHPSVHHDQRLAVVHRTKLLPPVDVVLLDGRRVTSPARTLWDLTSSLGPTLHREVVETQLTIRRPSTVELVACHRAMARRGRKGTTKMRALLLDILDDEPFPESDLERMVQAGLASRGSFHLQRQFKPPWYNGVAGVVDFADPVGMTIIEADGRRWHSTEKARRSDLARDLDAGRHGWFVLRIGWQEVVHRNETIMDEVADLVAQRRVSGLERRAS